MEISSDQINLLLIGVGVVVGLFILFRVASTLLKGVFILAIVALVIYLWQGGTVKTLPEESIGLLFKKSSLTEMVQVNCPPSKAEKLTCDCVVPVVYQDITARLSTQAQSDVEGDWPSLKQEILVSIKAQKQPIRQCFVREGGGDILRVLDKIWDGARQQE